MGVDEQARRRWRQVQDLFHRARELERGERAAFLRQHCKGDAAVLNEVTELLEDALPEDTLGLETPGRPATEDLSGRRLGHYELLRIIGRGSMGVIYEARQEYVQRSVALKILRRRRDVLDQGGSPEVYERMSARFREEAEVLGLLDHPGIVPIHEMARDQRGRNYFTMRLVRGDDFRRIIERVHDEADGFGLARALPVVLRVCETMAFAHDRGVLHRDLKPSHVMVGRFGEVYIVDWGLAKVQGRAESRDIRIRQDLPASWVDGAVGTHTPSPLCTMDGDVIGTPAYMPPEQAQGWVGELDVRSDVYAIGALLYHLLSGRVPYVRAAERGVAAQEILERVKRSAPPALDEHDVPPALAAICNKAMARDPAQRYDDMQALAADLQAFAENRVVRAYRTGAFAELWKWVHRNPGLASAIGLVALVAAGWIGSVLYLQSRSNLRLEEKNQALARAVEIAQRERDRSTEQALIASATKQFLDDMFRSVDPALAQGETATVRDALDRAAERLEGAFPDQPEVEAAIRMTIGVTYRQLGLYAQAEPQLAWAFETRRCDLGGEHPETIRSMEEYGVVLGERGRFDQAEEYLRRSLEEHRRTLGEDARQSRVSTGRLARLLFDRGRFEEARGMARRLLPAAGEGLASGDEQTLLAYEVLGSIHYRRDELEQAEEMFLNQLDLDHGLFGEEHSNTLVATTNLVTVLDAMGRRDEAWELSQNLVQRLEEVYGPRHRVTLVNTVNSALLLCGQGRVHEGVELLLDTIALEREVLGDDHPETMLSVYNLAETLRRNQRAAEAVPLYRELLAWQRVNLPEDHPDLLRSLHGLADCLLSLEAYAEALEALEEFLALQDRTHGEPLTDRDSTLFQIASCYERLGLTAR